MPTLVLRETISPASKVPASALATLPTTSAPPNRSLEGVLIFSGIGLALLALAIVFRCLDLPQPYF